MIGEITGGSGAGAGAATGDGAGLELVSLGASVDGSVVLSKVDIFASPVPAQF